MTNDLSQNEMKIYEARETIASALDGEAHALWAGLDSDSRNAWAEGLAYGDETLDEIVSKIQAWSDALQQETR